MYYTIAYQFSRAEEIRGPVISFPDLTLEEGKRSIMHTHSQLKGSEAKWANPELNVGNCLKSSKMD